MSKRSLQQQKVVSYALFRGKLLPRDEVIKAESKKEKADSESTKDNADSKSEKGN